MFEPKYKRDRFIFVSNLKNVTADPENPITAKRDAYLLSEHYTTPSALVLANWARSKKNLMVSDNGNFTRMKKIARDFEPRGKQLLELAEQELEEQGKISIDTFNKRKELIIEIVKACKDALEKEDFQEIIHTQLKMQPHYMIGLEELTIPVLMIANLVHPSFSPDPKEIIPFQNKTLALYHKQCNGEFGFKEEMKGILKFLVLHAYDYQTAFQGVQNFVDKSPEAIAISYGGAMRSRRYITSINLGREIIQLPEKLPEPYLISQAITLGALNASKQQVPIHILGLGSPILITLIASLLRKSPAISIDSTAPFKDAYAGTIYGGKYAYLKMDMYKVAAYALIQNKPFNSTTPFFRKFEKEFPSNWQGLRSELALRSSTSVKQLTKDLETNPEFLEKYIPFFSKMRRGTDRMMAQLRIARSGHNFWILRNICRNVIKRKDNPQALQKWVAYQVERYVKIASPKWAKAVQISFEIMEKYRTD